MRFTPYHPHAFHDNERAVIYFPLQMQDEIERMFLLMAVLETETQRLDVREFIHNINAPLINTFAAKSSCSDYRHRSVVGKQKYECVCSSPIV